jgi:putative ABC transport system permease protein
MASIPLAIRLAFRSFARRRALALGRLATVTALVASVSAILTVASTILLRPLPFPHAERLVRVYFQPPGTSSFDDADSLDALAFVRLRERTNTMDAFVGIFAVDQSITGDGEPESVLAGRVTRGFFTVLGAQPLLGRTFTDEEFAAGAHVVVLSHGMWRRRFGTERTAVGRVLTIDREPFTIVGVLREGFEPAFAASEFWTPLDLRKPNPYFSGIQTIGRLKEGKTAAAAHAELNALLPDVAREVPEAFNGWTLGALDLREAQYGSRRSGVLLLLAVVAGLTLLSIANLANLTLADVLGRRMDYAIRAALGASRRDLVAADLVQSGVIAASGAAAGLLLALAVVPVALALDASDLPIRSQLTLDWRVAGCALALAAAVMLLAVVAPAVRLAQPDFAGVLAVGPHRTTGSRSAHRARFLLVGAQSALATMLLGSGAIVIVAFDAASRVSPGFDPENLVTARLRLSEIALPTSESRGAFIEQLLQRVRETPGVLGASTTLNWFVPGQGGAQSLAFVEERPTADGAPYRIQSRRVTPGYFATMRIPLVSGRDFSDQDRMGRQPVAIVSRSFAQRFWPRQDPLGRRVKRGVTTKEWSIVVGVAEDVRDVSLDEAPRDTLYTPFLQSAVSPLPVTLVVRTAGDSRAFIGVLKQAVWTIDPDQALANIITGQEFLRGTLGRQRFRAVLVAAYAGLGLLLAIVGTYGVTARSVAERTGEVGVRLALGGTARRVWWTVAAASVNAVLAGGVAGACATLGTRGILIALLPEVRNASWIYAAFASGFLVSAGLITAFAAARRVVSTSPSEALRAG